MPHRSIDAPGLSILAIAAGFALQLVVLAQAPVLAATVQPANLQVAQALKSAHKLLAEANADYNGHRALAAQHVRNALKQLETHHGHRKAYTRSVATGAAAAQKNAQHAAHSGTHEPQSTSDAQLQQAQQILQNVVVPLGSNHPKAATHVKAALEEINRALAVR